ncbi:MAG: cytochrome P460 family protein [Verrucomicrobiota bacterium]
MAVALLLSASIVTGCDSNRPVGPANPDAEADHASGGAAGAGGQAGQGGHAGIAGGTGGGDIATIMATYKTWEPQSATAVDISAEIFSLCRAPNAAEDAFTKSAHSRFQLRDWANPAAVAGIAAKGAGGFAVGSTIVKEKFAAAAAGGAFELAALGMMIKRAPGFDPTGGNWEFVYWSATDGVSRGRAQLATCSTCHAGAAASDFVFVDGAWRLATGR